MKTSSSIEQQESRKEDEKSGNFSTHNSGPVSEKRRGRIENLKSWKPGQSGNPGGKPKVDLAAEIARAIFANDGPAIYDAYRKMLRKGSPYAFQVLSERGFGKLKETYQHEIHPYQDATEEELVKRLHELEGKLRELGDKPQMLPPGDDTKPN